MQIYGAYTRGIQGHLFTVSATPNAAGRLHVTGVRDTTAQHTAATVDAALKRFGMCNVGADLRLEPAGAGDPPLDTGRYSGTLDLPIALALLGMTGKLALDRIAGIVAVGGLDPHAAIESVGVRCIGAGGTTAIAHAVQARGLRLIVAEDQAAAALKAIERAKQSGPPRDEYNELQGALKRGRAAASRLGHTLTRWKRRAYAPNTAATAFCRQCRATALVNLEHASDAYGPALASPCSAPKTDRPA